MKKTISKLLLLLFIFVTPLVFSQDSLAFQEKRIIDSRFKIQRISSVKHAYVIEGLNLEDSLIYKIVSLKKRKPGHPKISEGEVYRLLIKPHFREMKMILSNPMTAVVIIEDKKVYIKGRGENIYICSNLIGLSFIPPDEIR